MLAPSVTAPFTVVRIAVAHVQPQRAVVAQDSARFAEDVDHVGDKFVGFGFQTQLAVDAIIAQPEIGRRRHDAMDAAVGQFLQPFAAVAD
jgi:hypothetical protein